MYDQKDTQMNQKNISREVRRMLLCMLPCFAAAAAAFFLRVEPLCIAATAVMFFVMYFLWDLRLGPQLRYRTFLREITSGLSRETVGELVRVSPDPVYQDGVYSKEIFINIYEDLSEEGERRFLLDCAKTLDERLMGRDIVVTSHGSYAIGIEPVETQA